MICGCYGSVRNEFCSGERDGDGSYKLHHDSNVSEYLSIQNKCLGLKCQIANAFMNRGRYFFLFYDDIKAKFVEQTNKLISSIHQCVIDV